MGKGMRKQWFIVMLFTLIYFLPQNGFALIEVHEGNEPVQNMGWPTGSEAVANLPSRLGYQVGPPFGGGEYRFEYRCEATAKFNEALQKFGAIRVPKTSWSFQNSFDGQIIQLLGDKKLLLVVHDGPKDRWNKKQTGEEKRVDWTFTVWVPQNFHRLFSGAGNSFISDHPNYRQPVPLPRIDVYIGGECPIEWKEVNLPKTVRVHDNRRTAAPVNVDRGGAIQGGVYDMGTHQVIAGAGIVVVKQTDQRQWEAVKETKSDRHGNFQLDVIPEGYYSIHIKAEGYVSRNVGPFNNRSGHAFNQFDTLLIEGASLQGIVTDPDGNPIPGVQVSASSTQGIDGLGYECAETPSVKTGSDGRFVLSGLPEGFAQIRCRAPSLHQKSPLFELHQVSNRPWDKPEEIQIVMTGTGVVRGNVVGKDGKASNPKVVTRSVHGGDR